MNLPESQHYSDVSYGSVPANPASVAPATSTPTTLVPPPTSSPQPALFASLTRLPKPVLGLLVVVLGVAAVGLWQWQPWSQTTRAIRVVGVGTKTVVPTTASVSFSFVLSGQESAGTLDRGETEFTKIITGLQAFQPKEVTQTSYQLLETPRSQVQDGRLQTGTAFQYVNAARVVSNDPQNMDELIKYLYRSGATTVTQIRYSADEGDQEQLEDELRDLAVGDAKDKAEQLAKSAGARLGKVISIQEAASNSQVGTPVVGAQSDAVAAEQLNALGQIDLQTVVTVVYELH